jgi:hypothetical protein
VKFGRHYAALLRYVPLSFSGLKSKRKKKQQEVGSIFDGFFLGLFDLKMEGINSSETSVGFF